PGPARLRSPDSSPRRGAGKLKRGWKCAAYGIFRGAAPPPEAPAAIFKEAAHSISQKRAATESAEVSLELLPRLHRHRSIERPGDSDADKAGNISAYGADGRRSGVDALVINSGRGVSGQVQAPSAISSPGRVLHGPTPPTQLQLHWQWH